MVFHLHQTFNIVFCAYAKGGMIDEAMHIFVQMRQRGSSPDAVSYGTLIDALCKLGRVDEAMLKFNQMINERVTPNIVVFSSLVMDCAVLTNGRRPRNYFLKC